jgi:hypothetical protein
MAVSSAAELLKPLPKGTSLTMVKLMSADTDSDRATVWYSLTTPIK